MKWLKSLPARIVEGVLATVAVAALSKSLGLFDEHWELLVALAGLLIVGGAAYSLGLRRGGKEDDLFSYYGEHVHEVIEAAQKLVSGTLTGVTVDDFVERGILAPAREGLQRDSVESIRMTVLAPNSDGTEFELVWESGHSVEARANFQMPVAGTFAGHALTTHATEWTNDVDGDPRWTPHPKARSSRTYGSLVSAPIKQGETVVGVLNVISSYKNAFTRGDIIYIEILASMIDVVWGLRAMTGGADT